MIIIQLYDITVTPWYGVIFFMTGFWCDDYQIPRYTHYDILVSEIFCNNNNNNTNDHNHNNNHHLSITQFARVISGVIITVYLYLDMLFSVLKTISTVTSMYTHMNKACLY